MNSTDDGPVGLSACAESDQARLPPPSEADLAVIDRESVLLSAELVLVDAESAWFDRPSQVTADGVAWALVGVVVAWRVTAAERLAVGDVEGFAPWGWSA